MTELLPTSLENFPLLRKLLLRQVLVAVCGLLVVAAAFAFVEKSQRSALEARAKDDASLVIKQRQEELRTWASMGLDEALAAEEKDYKRRLGLEFLRLVQEEERPAELGPLDIVVPEAPDDRLRWLVHARLAKEAIAAKRLPVSLITGLLVCILAAFLLVLLNLNRFILKDVYGPIRRLIDDLPRLGKKDGVLRKEDLAQGEIKDFIEKLESLHLELLELQKKDGEFKAAERLNRMASQVAHDVRSPLAALDSVMKDLSELPEEKRSIIRGAVSRIRDIANDLIERNRNASAAASAPGAEVPSIHLISSHTDILLSEKRLQFRSKMGVEIDSRLEAASYGLFARIQPIEFKRVLSNLINNSVEAVGEKGRVIVELTREAGWTILRVSDDGPGIPPELLPRLGRRGETHGKEGGSGLGLYHARTNVESWGGALDIRSEVGKGTVVTIRLPQAPAPDWFVSELELDENGVVVILDDDTSIHQVWQGRFDSQRLKEQSVEAFHFSTPQEFRRWVQANPAAAAKAVYLLDYELLGHAENGLSLAEEFGLGARTILVTSRFEERAILDGCARLGVRLIPKGMAGFVPIRVRQAAAGAARCDAVLIDDDKLVHAVWKAAARAAGKSLLVFSRPGEFEAACGGLDKRTPIYVDSGLADGVRGEDFARGLSDRGFERLILCTGHSPDSFPKMPWISAIVGKGSPWPDQRREDAPA